MRTNSNLARAYVGATTTTVVVTVRNFGGDWETHGPLHTLRSCTSDAEREMRSMRLEEAATLVIDHGLAVRKAARACDVPRSSVHRRVLARQVGCEQGKCDIDFLCRTTEGQ